MAMGRYKDWHHCECTDISPESPIMQWVSNGFVLIWTLVAIETEGSLQ